MQIKSSGTKEAYRVLPHRSTKSKLVKCEALPTSIDNPGPGCLCEPQGSDLHCRDLLDPLVVCDCTNNHSDALLVLSQKKLLMSNGAKPVTY